MIHGGFNVNKRKNYLLIIQNIESFTGMRRQIWYFEQKYPNTAKSGEFYPRRREIGAKLRR